MKTEIGGNGATLGKPYEPNAIIKSDIEFILMFRKPGGYRRPTIEQRGALADPQVGSPGLVPADLGRCHR